MADHERRLTGRAASMAKRRAIADGGKTGRPSPASARQTRRTTARPEPRHETGHAPEPALALRTASERRPVGMPEGRRRSLARRDQLTRGRAASISPATTNPPAAPGLVGRAAAIARRRAIAGQALAATPRTSHPRDRQASVSMDSPKPAIAPSPQSSTGARRQRASRPRGAPVLTKGPARGRMLSMARRAALAGRGKTGAESVSGRSSRAATTSLLRSAGASSRDIARRVREERCEHGKCGDLGPRPTGRTRRPDASRAPEASARSAASATALGQIVTGTQVGRNRSTTGNETGACRQVTGTEYMGAEVFQEFCGIGPTPAPNRQAGATVTSGGQRVTGDQVGRSPKVTGDESGAGRQLTGTPYTAAGPEGAPPKVGTTRTLGGQAVTGSLVGRQPPLTGTESGACQRVTGNEYLGFEHFEQVCKTRPEPVGTRKVSADTTWRGQTVTGSLVARSPRVTGNEPGACEIVTGTAYLGAAQVAAECGQDTARQTAERLPAGRATPGFSLTGLQPGVGGVMTGDARGACREVTGTPYLGGDQFFGACGESSMATPGSDDFPQPLSGAQWSAFSIATPARVAQERRPRRTVTGAYDDEERGRITGPFTMGTGRVTGTEGFRARRAQERRPPVDPGVAQPTADTAPASEEGRPRITGEGLDGGPRITGDDWGRNERVTGTEGRSAHSRNPTRRGSPMAAFAGARQFRESQDRPVPGIHVTGSSGGTERGALVTLSGGARG